MKKYAVLGMLLVCLCLVVTPTWAANGLSWLTSVTASNDQGAVTYWLNDAGQLQLAEAIGTSASKVFDGSQKIMIGGKNVGTIYSLGLTWDQDPFVAPSFSVTGPGLKFIVRSLILTFPAISPANGYAEADFELATAGTATATGLLSKGKIFEARYNATSWTNGTGTVFATMIGGMTAKSASVYAYDRSPQTGMKAIPGSVSSIGAQYQFALGGDCSTATGNGKFEVVPEPGTILAALSILGPAGLIFRRKRA